MLLKDLLLVIFIYTNLYLCQETTTTIDEVTDTTTLDLTTTDASTTVKTKSTTITDQEDTTTSTPKHPILQICESTQTVKNNSMTAILRLCIWMQTY